MLQRFRASMARFMTGRNGVDQLGWFLLILSVVLNLIGSFVQLPIFQLLAYIPLALTLYRTFSRNVPKRYAENQKSPSFFPGSRAEELLLLSVPQLQNPGQGAQRQGHHPHHLPQLQGKVRQENVNRLVPAASAELWARFFLALSTDL